MLDFQFAENGDLDISNGEIRWGESASQHQQDLLITAPGGFKEFPSIGIDSIRYLHDGDSSAYLRAVREQFKRDGMKVKSISMDENNNLIIDADYEES